MLKALSLAKTQLKEFQKATGQHCCSSQHDEQIETTNITLFVEVEALGISLHLQLELSEQAAAHYSTAPHPGEQSEFGARVAGSPCSQPWHPAGHEDTKHTAGACTAPLPPRGTPGTGSAQDLKETSITVRAVPTSPVWIDREPEHKGGSSKSGRTEQPVPFYTTQANVKHLLKTFNIHLQKLGLRTASHGDKSSSDTQKNKSYSTDHSPDFKCITEVTIWNTNNCL